MPLLSGLWAFSFKITIQHFARGLLSLAKFFNNNNEKQNSFTDILPSADFLVLYIFRWRQSYFSGAIRKLSEADIQKPNCNLWSQRKTAAHHSNQTQRKAGNERYRNLLFGRLAKAALEIYQNSLSEHTIFRVL